MEDLRQAARAQMDRLVAELQALVRWPSVSAQGRAMAETAAAVAGLIRGSGGQAEVLPGPGYPVVWGHFDGDGDRTLLFYNHYDVQPPEPLAEWTVDPFGGQVRDGCIYGRGTADNKGEIAVRLAAIRLLRERHGGRLPCRVTFLIEGEEETGSYSLAEVLRRHGRRFAADACVWEFGGVNPEGRPDLYGGVKGMAYLQFTVRHAAVDMHSSLAAVVPNPAWRLVWALASLKGPDGRVLVPGFYDGVRPPTDRERQLAAAVPFVEAEYTQVYGVRQPLLASGPAAAEALAFAPTCTICGLEAGYDGPGCKTVLPRQAQAKVDCRLVPDQDPRDIFFKVRRHLDYHGFTDVEVELLSGERAYRTDPDHPFVALALATAREAWGAEPVYHVSSAGTGPMYPVAEALRVPIVSAGSGYYGSRAHAPDEHVRLADLERGVVHMALLLERFGRG